MGQGVNTWTLVYPLSYSLKDSDNVVILQRFCLKFENSTSSRNDQYKAKATFVLAVYVDKGKVTKGKILAYAKAAFIIWNGIKKFNS